MWMHKEIIWFEEFNEQEVEVYESMNYKILKKTGIYKSAVFKLKMALIKLIY